MKFETWANLLIGAFIAAVAAGAIWMQVAAPCSWYRLSSASDVPARCLGYFAGARR